MEIANRNIGKMSLLLHQIYSLSPPLFLASSKKDGLQAHYAEIEFEKDQKEGKKRKGKEEREEKRKGTGRYKGMKDSYSIWNKINVIPAIKK